MFGTSSNKQTEIGCNTYRCGDIKYCAKIYEGYNSSSN